MRLQKFALAVACVLGLFGVSSGRQCRTCKDPYVVGGAGRELGVHCSGKEGFGEASGQVLHRLSQCATRARRR